MAAESAAGRLVDRRRVLRLRVQARRTRLLILRADREGHRAQGERCDEQHQSKTRQRPRATQLLGSSIAASLGSSHWKDAVSTFG